MMLCVLIACGSHTRMVNEHETLVADGIKLVELRVDFLRRPPDLSRLLNSRPSATILTARRVSDGGVWSDTEAKRQTLLRAAVVAGVEAVDLELDIAKSIPRFGKTRRLISYHNTKQTPEDLDSLYAEMAACDPDAIKLAVMPQSLDDVLRLMRFVAAKNAASPNTTSPKIPTVGIALGELGVMSRLLAGKLGMPFTYASFSAARIVAAGLLEYREMRDQWRAVKVTDETKVFGVIGNPISHSLSPTVHNASFISTGVDAIYLPIEVKSAELKTFCEVVSELGFCGVSVTIPHKESVVSQLTKCDTLVEQCGACNTILFKDGEKIGYNTDALAATLAIERKCGGRGNENPSVIDGKRALILGAGGVGRAIAFGLQRRGVICTITNRNAARGEELAKSLGCDFCVWENRHDVAADFLINATSVGMSPQVKSTPFDSSALRSEMLVFDAVYTPEETLLLKNAREKGCATISGVELFIGQAMLQFRLFTGEKGSQPIMRAAFQQAASVAVSGK